MKITNQQLKRLIKEELAAVLKERDMSDHASIVKQKHRKPNLKKLIIKELRKLVQEQAEDWDGLRDAYYQCRNKANGGNAPKLTMRRVNQHVAKAKSMPNGWSKLVMYVEKRYPGCLVRAGMIPSGA